MIRPFRVFRRLRTAYRQTRAAAPVMANSIGTYLYFMAPALHGTRFEPVCRFQMGQFTFFARRSDWLAVQEVALDDEYGPVRELLLEKEAPTVVDLGANIGMFSGLVLNLRPMATIHSVEPSLATFRILDRNRRANPHARWRTYWSAMWSNDGQVNFSENSAASMSSYVDTSAGEAMVPAMSLTTLFSEHVNAPVDILKMDIEGAEEAVLRQGESILSTVDTLIVEIHPNRCDPIPVVRTLERTFKYLYETGDRRSSKPVVVATRRPCSLPVFRGLANIRAGD